MPTETGAGEKMVRPAPQVVIPTKRWNIALPFSSISIQEPGADFSELATIVDELAGVVEHLVPGPTAKELRVRSSTFAARARRAAGVQGPRRRA